MVGQPFLPSNPALLREQERFIFEVTEALSALMEERGVNQSELARRMNVRPSVINKMLSGRNNFTLRTLSDALFMLGKSARIELGEIGETVHVPVSVLLPFDDGWRQVQNMRPVKFPHLLNSVPGEQKSIAA